MAWSVLTSVQLAADGAADDYFGHSTALSRDGLVLAVGAFFWEGTSGTERGGVYIYDWSGSAWIQRGSVLEASDAADYDLFGSSVALSTDGDILVVGAQGWEGASGSGRGGVYIYDWSGSAWVQRGSVLEAADAADGDQFGGSVGLSSDGAILAVGAPIWEGASGTDRGGVYIYDWSGSAWVQRGSVLAAADAANSDYFGQYVALNGAGTILAVGTGYWEGVAGTDRGGVYIYDWSGSAWTQRGSVVEAADAADGDKFGSVALSTTGTILVIGALDWEGASGTGRGGVYTYDWSGSAWTPRDSVLEAADAANNDQFGSGVALSGDAGILVVGAHTRDGGALNKGAFYTYETESLVATAPISITVTHNSGTATAPIKINVRQSGTASAPLRISVVDSLQTASWSATVSLAGTDVSARLTGQINVDAEEGAARVASFALLPAAGAINPVAWTGSAVTIDLLRVIGGVSVPSRLFTGKVDLASYEPQTRLVSFTCTDDIQHRVAALTVAQVDALTGGLYSRAAQGEIDDRWDYAQARMESRQASLDAGPHGNLRVTDWAGLTTWRTFTTADVTDASLSIDLPRRQDLINSIEIAYEYRYHRLRERWASVAWSGSIIGLAPASAGYQFPSFDAVSGAVGGLGWHVISQTYNDAYAYVKVSKPAGAPDGADTDWWIYNGGDGISNYSARLAQRHAQTVTEAYALSVTAPASISANGTLVSSLRGALASDWSPAEWEADMSVTPDASSADQDYSPDATRAESDTAIETLLAIAKTRILSSHRKARASFSIPCLPELDLVHAVELDTGTLDCEGKVARLVHVLDLVSGAATTTVTVALSGIAAGGIVDETALAPPAVPDIDAATGDDDWVAAIPHLASIHVGATDALSDPYSESLMGFLCNAPQRASYYNFTLDAWYSVTNADYNEALAYPSTGFRASMPGVADTHRNPLTLDQSADYDVDVPEDPLTLTA